MRRSRRGRSAVCMPSAALATAFETAAMCSSAREHHGRRRRDGRWCDWRWRLLELLFFLLFVKAASALQRQRFDGREHRCRDECPGSAPHGVAVRVSYPPCGNRLLYRAVQPGAIASFACDRAQQRASGQGPVFDTARLPNCATANTDDFLGPCDVFRTRSSQAPQRVCLISRPVADVARAAPRAKLALRPLLRNDTPVLAAHASQRLLHAPRRKARQEHQQPENDDRRPASAQRRPLAPTRRRRRNDRPPPSQLRLPAAAAAGTGLNRRSPWRPHPAIMARAPPFPFPL